MSALHTDVQKQAGGLTPLKKVIIPECMYLTRAEAVCSEECVILQRTSECVSTGVCGFCSLT